MRSRSRSSSRCLSASGLRLSSSTSSSCCPSCDLRREMKRRKRRKRTTAIAPPIAAARSPAGIPLPLSMGGEGGRGWRRGWWRRGRWRLGYSHERVGDGGKVRVARRVGSGGEAEVVRPHMQQGDQEREGGADGVEQQRGKGHLQNLHTHTRTTHETHLHTSFHTSSILPKGWAAPRGLLAGQNIGIHTHTRTYTSA